LVEAVTEAIRAPHDEQAPGNNHILSHYNSSISNGFATRRRGPHPERIAERVERAGYTSRESLLVALAAHATIASPLNQVDVEWIASVASRIGDADLLLEAAGVVFAFNTINRIADARRVRLEYRFLRELKPIRGWLERRLASLTGLAYDMSYKHRPHHSPAELLDRLGVVFERVGAASVPHLFNWLSRSPVVLEGVLEMIEVNVMRAGVRFDLLKEAAAIAVASRAMPGSSLSRAAEEWLTQGSLPDLNTLRSWAGSPTKAADSCLVSACRRYSWQVANAAYTISDAQIRKISALGLVDAERLDLTLATALFSALAIIEPISAAVEPLPIAAGIGVAVDTPNGHVTGECKCLSETSVEPPIAIVQGPAEPSFTPHPQRVGHAIDVVEPRCD
jgi:alkylhydroperoxidase family enzyme